MNQQSLILRNDKDRFVAFSFCWADLLMELSPSRHIAFAAGPTEAFIGRTPAQLVGLSFDSLIAKSDRVAFGPCLREAERLGRLENGSLHLIHASSGQELAMSLSGYWLDGPGGNLFLGLRRQAEADPAAPTATAVSLADARAFSAAAAGQAKKIHAAGGATEVTTFVLNEIAQLDEHLDAVSRGQLRQHVATTLRAHSVGGNTAAEIDDGRYSILHEAGAIIDRVVEHIRRLTQAADPGGRGVSIETATMAMGDDVGEKSEADLAKGLLFVMKRFRDSRGKSFNIQSLGANIASLCDSAVREVNAFRTLLNERQFDMALQPVVDMTSGEIFYYEVLCRFRGGLADESPYPTITFAEETDMILDFDLAMVRKALHWLAARRASGLNTAIAVNLSGQSVGNPLYMETLLAMLSASSWSRSRVMFEITESARLDDLAAANLAIQKLRSAGYRVALDDFGAGATSFQYLSRLEVDIVKLDGIAVRHAEQAPKGHAFLSALTELCRRLGVKTIAEMIDTPKRLAFTKACGCDFVQGYLFGKPTSDISHFSPLPNANLFNARQWQDSTRQ